MIYKLYTPKLTSFSESYFHYIRVYCVVNINQILFSTMSIPMV